MTEHECVYSPSGFEIAGGKGLNRKWRLSIRVLLPDGSRGCTLDYWLSNFDGLEAVASSSINKSSTPSDEQKHNVSTKQDNENHSSNCIRPLFYHHSPSKYQRRSFQQSSPNASPTKDLRVFLDHGLTLYQQSPQSKPSSPQKEPLSKENSHNTVTISSGENVFTEDLASEIAASLKKEYLCQSPRKSRQGGKSPIPQSPLPPFVASSPPPPALDESRAFEPTLICEVPEFTLPLTITSPDSSKNDLKEVFEYADSNAPPGIIKTRHGMDDLYYSSPLRQTLHMPLDDDDAQSHLIKLFPPDLPRMDNDVLFDLSPPQMQLLKDFKCGDGSCREESPPVMIRFDGDNVPATLAQEESSRDCSIGGSLSHPRINKE